MSESQRSRRFLFIGGLGAVLASLCCLGPLLLLALGFSGAWLANLTALEPYRPIFIILSLIALFLPGNAFFDRYPAAGPVNHALYRRIVGGMPLSFGVYWR